MSHESQDCLTQVRVSSVAVATAVVAPPARPVVLAGPEAVAPRIDHRCLIWDRSQRRRPGRRVPVEEGRVGAGWLQALAGLVLLVAASSHRAGVQV